jgi:molybdopterin/thiamine biosynthesis adenylyltransferase
LHEPKTGAQSRTTIDGSVVVVGVGALGCAAARVLADAGVARITLVDADVVETSNLQRQVLFSDAHIGALKALAGADVLRTRAAHSTVTAVPARLDSSNAVEILADHDVVIDACDDPDTKFLLNRTAVVADVTYCYGGVARTAGQTLTVSPGRTACLACVFPTEISDADAEGCGALGILAPVAGVIGSLQGLAAVRCLLGDTDAVAGTMTIYDLRAKRWRSVTFQRRSACSVCGEISRPLEPRRLEPCPS